MVVFYSSYGSWGEGFHHSHVVFQNACDPPDGSFQSASGV